MVNTIRTQTDLLTNLFQTGQADGSITAQDIRDLIVSLGYGAYERSTSVFNDYTYAGIAISSSGPSTPSLTTFRDNIKLNAFTGTGTQINEGFFSIHLLHDLKAGSDMSFHIHWTHNNAAPSGNVKWYIDWAIARGYEAGTFPAADIVSSVQTAGAQYAHHITPDSDIVLTNTVEMEPDAILIGRIYRDPADVADTFEDDAFLMHIDLHYEMTRDGTTEKNRPFTSGGF